MRHLLLSAALALLSVTSVTAYAFDGHGHGHGRHHHERDWDDDDRDDDRDYYRERHYRHRDWHRGERIEVVYLEPRYYVDDYEYYHLRQPPRGHRWVRDEDGRFILVAVATGIIADILLHH
ncbi:RcnB family protein [Lysobacter tyrosinilyticus]